MKKQSLTSDTSGYRDSFLTLPSFIGQGSLRFLLLFLGQSPCGPSDEG